METKQFSPFVQNIVDTIESSNAKLNGIQSGRLKRAFTMLEEDADFYEKVKNCIRQKLYIKNYTKFDDRFVIVEVEDDFATFRTVDLEKGNTLSECSNDYEIQFLITMGYKYDGNNSQFATYACKMVGKQLPE